MIVSTIFVSVPSVSTAAVSNPVFNPVIRFCATSSQSIVKIAFAKDATKFSAASARYGSAVIIPVTSDVTNETPDSNI